MEKIKPPSTRIVSPVALQQVAEVLGCSVEELHVVAVDGGYSRNRRALVGCDGSWVFAKEVDKSLLDSDGSEELSWLQKDHKCIELLGRGNHDLVPEWSQLEASGHVLIMPAYREQDGWTWTLPDEDEVRECYIDAVISATKRLEEVMVEPTEYERLSLQPYFRDHLAFDDGYSILINDDAVRLKLIDRYLTMASDGSLAYIKPFIEGMIVLLNSDRELDRLAAIGAKLADQPNDCLGHCDVRSDNVAYNRQTGELKMVDWNWASFVPRKFGSTEFLIDMARRGVDVSRWLSELNPEMLAATVGFYAKRCLREPLSPGSKLREMQAESAAVALGLYEMSTRL